MSYRTSNVLRALILGSTLIAGPALAYVSSSCPAPCAKPPKSALFMRESNGLLNANSYTPPLTGLLSRGSARTVVRVDATILLPDRETLPVYEIWATLNGEYQDPLFSAVIGSCGTHPTCSVTGTFWFDVDELEAANPGTFVGQPLSLVVGGSPLTGNAPGHTYRMSFSAQVVKKK